MSLDSSVGMAVARIAVIAGLVLYGAITAFATLSPSEPEAGRIRIDVTESLGLPQSASLIPAGTQYREERFLRGDSLAALLDRLGVVENERASLARLPVVRQLRPGTSIAAEVDSSGRLLRAGFLHVRDQWISIMPQAGEFVVVESDPAFDGRIVMKSGVIRSSLFAAADAAGIPDGVTTQIADIFGGDIDFHRDLRRGDRFSVVFEQRALDGRPVRSGRVLAAEFINQGKLLRAVFFEGTAGKGYFAPDGKNLRKAFLRSPLEFSRVSSGFGMRVHPFLRTWRAHAGTDYAAAIGTPVRATGDGVVEFAGRQGGYGNVVILRHGSGINTLYAHLSAFGRGVQKGKRVAQGDIVGSVGQTGWATGPHLHYEFHVAGVARDSLAIALPAAAPVPPEERVAFLARIGPLAERLDLLAGSNLAALE